jgi:ATP-dependent Lon protease
VEEEMDDVMNIMEKSIYGHSRAKSQIMKIIGQWMNGKLSGYCFGFEGSPGIGKTSLAKKGISKCLKDENDETRPFSFIALGGSANGSTIEGHSYTYMNSTWGKIVEILMDSKCMNPIIYIDELDKVSKTEHGKEIIGILTHMIDSTQNDSFQDKYFSGVDIDLSKALFIFSYNDPEQIDRILLDRIHRIKFDNLTLEDKMVIVKDYILPEINEKMGFENVVDLTDTLIQYIIENYTIEPGVRKLKELLFDMYGEINLEILKIDMLHNVSIPLQLTERDIDTKYLKNYKKVNEKRIHSSPEKGIINGLWANVLGHGGIIPIQCMLFPSSNFLELRLTGLQGDVMKESMNVAKTLAWDLTPEKRIKSLLKQFNDTKKQGLHIHCPEGAISKDGPSAGTAITVAIYSIFNNKEIKHDIAITGEINLQGQVTPIGGLDIKIIGGIKAGVKTFLYPKGNERDYEEWRTNNKKDVDGIRFVSVSHIKEVFNYVFVE